MKPVLVWFNNDLRLTNHPALAAVADLEAPMIGCYILDDGSKNSWKPGAPARWWLLKSLLKLDQQFREEGGLLVFRRGSILATLKDIANETNARSIFWSKRYDFFDQGDDFLQTSLKESGIHAQVFENGLLYESGKILSQSGQPFKRFTPFYRACIKNRSLIRTDAPKVSLKFSAVSIRTESPLEWNFFRETNYLDQSLGNYWKPGEFNALEEFHIFSRDHANNYIKRREEPGLNATSKLSPHINFGEISVVDIWTQIQGFNGRQDNDDLEAYLRQLFWREFSYHLLYYWNSLPYAPLNPSFENFPWIINDDYLAAWKNGETGYPFVDAGMRQLRSIGWMHNRARMVAASFLVKQLLVPWQEGQAWFWESLVDANIANNAASWQWVAGCGVDAAPYFRIFNPVLQGKRFDSNGAYIRAWVPELRELPEQWIHQPWCAPDALMRSAGIRLGHNYPNPIIDLDDGRRQALAAWKKLKKSNSKELVKRAKGPKI